MKIKILTAIGFFCLPFCSFGMESAVGVNNPNVKVSEHVLKIETTPIQSVYTDEHRISASAFWLGGDSRIIVTSTSVASTNAIARFEAQDDSGNKFPLKLIYSNPLVDLAYLVPEEEDIVQPVYSLALCIKPELGTSISSIGNNGNGTVTQEGRINDICDQGSYCKGINISLSGKGGSIGSMVINKQLEVIGMTCSIGNVHTVVIPAEFIQEDLSYLQRGSIPPKKDIGISFNYVSENDAKEFYKYSLPSIKEYNEQFKGARGRLLQVQKTSLATPGEKLFEPGDIITHVNGAPIGPDLFKYYSMLNAHGQEVDITLFRDGNKIVLNTPTYDLNQNQCLDMILFGKAIIARSTPKISYSYGLPVGTVGLFRNPPGNIFSAPRRPADFLILHKLGNRKIESLDDVEEFIRTFGDDSAVTKFNYTATVLNSYSPRPTSYQATYERKYHQTPVRMMYDCATKEWAQKEIKSTGVKLT